MDQIKHQNIFHNLMVSLDGQNHNNNKDSNNTDPIHSQPIGIPNNNNNLNRGRLVSAPASSISHNLERMHKQQNNGNNDNDENNNNNSNNGQQSWCDYLSGFLVVVKVKNIQ